MAALTERFITVAKGTRIPEEELAFSFQRSGGPGGQNVNKVSTRVTLLFDLAGTASLTEQQKQRIRDKLAGRINSEGVLRVVSSRHRTQTANRKAAVERFGELLSDALHVEKNRRKTKVPRAERHKRREEKARRARTKQLRRPPSAE